MPNITIRHVQGQEQLDILYLLDNYAFYPSPPFQNREEWETRMKTRKGTLYYAVFEGKEPVAITACIPLTQNIRGETYQMCGYADISTHPKARRKGYIRQLMRYTFQQIKDRGDAVSCLYPFRGSFYERLGYVTFPQTRKAIIKSADLAPILKWDLEGETQLTMVKESYDAYLDFTIKMQPKIHGMAVIKHSQKESAAQSNRNWVLQARVNGETVGLMSYSLKGEEMMNFTLQAPRFYYFTSQGKYLLLDWIARHIDQATTAEIWLPAYERPGTWLADIRPKLEPVFVAPMGRVIDVAQMSGMKTGAGGFSARISDPDCLWNEGNWRFEGTDGRLRVTPTDSVDCQLTIESLSALVYGLNDPEDFIIRGWGEPSPAVIEEMRRMFPLQLPYLHEYY